LIYDLFEDIPSNSVVLKVIDITDVNGTFMPKMIDLAKRKNLHMVLIINKLDLLPKEYSYKRI